MRKYKPRTNCIECGAKIPGRVIIDGKERNLNNRTRCLVCLPFKSNREQVDCKVNRAEIARKRWKILSAKGYDPVRIRRSSTRYRLIQAMGGKCCICGYSNRPEALAFHHVDDSNKRFNLSSREFSLYSIEEIITEAKKCIILCHNCHAEYGVGLHWNKITERHKDTSAKLAGIDGTDDLPPLKNYISSELLRKCKDTGEVYPLTDFPPVVDNPLIPAHFATSMQGGVDGDYGDDVPENVKILSLDWTYKTNKPKAGICIYEDEWRQNKSLFKMMALTKKGIADYECRIRPQKCNICLIEPNTANEFYLFNHYLGACRATYHIGIYYDGPLIACMSIRKPVRQSDGDWEIARMARRSDVFVHGLWSYVLKWIIRKNLITGKLITFSDNRIHDGKVYSAMGLKFEYELRHDYYWVKDGIRYNKSSLRKKSYEDQGKTETELREAQGYHKIWDMGKKKWSVVL